MLLFKNCNPIVSTVQDKKGSVNFLGSPVRGPPFMAAGIVGTRGEPEHIQVVI